MRTVQIFKYRHTSFIALCVIEVHKHCIFYKLKATPSTSRKIVPRFIAILYYGGIEPALSLKYTCISCDRHSISRRISI